MEPRAAGRVRGTLTEGRRVEMTTPHHQLTADEPPALGGHDAAPGPFELVMAGLVSCTAITLRMYAERKGWEIGPIHVEATIVRHPDGRDHIERHVVVHGVDEVQRVRLAEIADRTPVTRTLAHGATIATHVRTEA